MPPERPEPWYAGLVPEEPEGVEPWHDEWPRETDQDELLETLDEVAEVANRSRKQQSRTATRTAYDLTADELADLLDDWVLQLRADNKSQQTVSSYKQGVSQFLLWAKENEQPPTLDRNTVNEFMVSMKDRGLKATTMTARQLAVRQFTAWLEQEKEIVDNLLIGLKAPKIDEQPLEPLTDEELKALFEACQGESFIDKRDEALARFMAETFARANDTLSMTMPNTNLKAGEAVLIGKGHKPRLVAWGPQTGVCMARYARARKLHRLATETDKFWLGGNGRNFGYGALYYTLDRRAEVAGIEGFHPHRLRATGATRWLDRGGSESGLRAAAGWASMRMVGRYTKFTSQRRAAAESRRLNLGDI
jgi:site-specific recombinase XerD